MIDLSDNQIPNPGPASTQTGNVVPVGFDVTSQTLTVGNSTINTGGTGSVVQVTASRNFMDSDNGKTLVFSGNWTLVVPPGLNASFGCACLPPATGNATIDTSGPSLNGRTMAITRTGANTLFAVITIGTNMYVVTGS